jgi:lipid-A-disaccharide synthase
MPSDAPKTIEHLLICTGDPSAAHHAADLVKQILARHPHLRITAVGNDELQEAGATLLAHHDDIGMGGWGITAALAGIWGHWQLAQKIKRFVCEQQVDRVLLMDYSGFHLKLARLLVGHCDLRYYIPPQLWASRPQRMKSIQAFIRKVYTIFPFENAWYEQAGVPYLFVGHPLTRNLPSPVAKSDFCTQYALEVQKPLIGLFPGSRVGEVKRMLPIFANALAQVQGLLDEKGPGVQIVMAQAPNLSTAFIEKAVKQAFAPFPQVKLTILMQANHAILSASDVILGASGTTSLEAALYGTPMVIAYQVDWISELVAKRIMTVPFIGLPNLLVAPEQAPILPERLQGDCTPELLAKDVLTFLDPQSSASRQATEGLAYVKQALGEGASLDAFVEDLVSLEVFSVREITSP